LRVSEARLAAEDRVVGFACVQCGQDLPAEARFCLRCGASLDDLPPPGRPEAVFRALEGPSIGRDDERAQLRRMWKSVSKAGTAATALLVGEPGSGKSRLVRDLLGETEARTIALRCTNAGEVLGLGPVAELLLELCAADATTDPAKLVKALAELLADDEPLARRLLGHAGLGQTVAGVDELPGDLGLLFRAYAEHGPLLLVVEDVDAAPVRLQKVLGEALLTCHDLPLLTVVTAVDASVAEVLDAQLVLHLERLSSTSVAELMVKALGGSPVVEDLVVPVAKAAAGSPFLLEQLLALLVDAGVLLPGDGEWHLSAVPTDLPTGLPDVLAARVEQLSVEERKTLECAVVLGDDMGVGELLALTAGGQDPSTALAALVERHVLQPRPDGQSYRFHHAALRDAAYRLTPKRRLAELHLRAADHFEHVAPLLRERIAVHLELAVGLHSHLEPAILLEPLARRAAHAWHELGRHALLVSELPGARQCLERGLGVAPAGSPERPALLQALAEVLLDQGEFEPALQLGLEAGALAQRSGEEAVRLLAELCRLRAESGTGARSPRDVVHPMRASATRLEARREWTRAPRAWLMVAEASVEGCDWEVAAAASNRACRRARETSSPDLAACLAVATLVAAHGPMPLAEAREVCRDALHEVPPETLASARCTADAALVAALDGRPDEATQLYDYAVDVSRWRDVPSVLGEVLLTGGRIALLEGRPADAATLLAEAAQVHAGVAPLASALEAYARVEAGDEAAGRAALARAGHLDGAAWRALEQVVVVGLVESCLLRTTDPVAAVSAASKAVRTADELGTPVLQGEASRVLAEALTRVEALDDARDALDAAREHFVAKGAHALLPRLALASAGR
jgi:tetratricopeptide (TPR) repeat protein